VAAGYLRRPSLTAQRFGPDPLGLLPGNPFYRTGDLVERRGDELVYLGRADRQVKIRGHRVELGEVEAAVCAVDDVAEAVALLGSTPERPVIGCAYTTRSGRPVAPRTLRADLRRQVPHYMVPARLKWFARMPLTVNGKIDMQVLGKEMELTR
jgi:acyl-coenzyme A synthetase/AMP-(fatty) acid ligase